MSDVGKTRRTCLPLAQISTRTNACGWDADGYDGMQGQTDRYVEYYILYAGGKAYKANVGR